VFSYPGASADMILNRFKSDEKRMKLDGNKVDTIILLCGSNDVDSILNSPRYCRDELLTYGKFSQNARALDKTNNSIENLVLFLHQWANSANIKIVNLLPRESSSRNEVISNINQFISKLPERHSFLTMISTEKDRYLFVDKYGFRKSRYFSMKGDDNIHLNTDGVIKLAKHLKYHAHL
jgi:lysophospholipase L1-like esterase